MAKAGKAAWDRGAEGRAKAWQGTKDMGGRLAAATGDAFMAPVRGAAWAGGKGLEGAKWAAEKAGKGIDAADKWSQDVYDKGMQKAGEYGQSIKQGYQDSRNAARRAEAKRQLMDRLNKDVPNALKELGVDPEEAKQMTLASILQLAQGGGAPGGPAA